MDALTPPAAPPPENLGVPVERPAPAPAQGVVALYEELLKRPDDFVARSRHAPATRNVLLLGTGALVGIGAYGASAGFFQGGMSVAVAAFKAPLIVLLTTVLCVPSLFVFTTLAGADMSLSRLAHALAGFVGMLAVLLAGLLPMSWLFSVSSRSMGFAIFIHVLAWFVSLWFAYGFLQRAVPEKGTGAVLFTWLLLFTITSFQATTFLRPVLWLSPGESLFSSGKLFFMEHLSGAEAPAPAAASAATSPR